ncbi:polysaccharide biosynthesis protein [Pararhizobium mangrovi]|uniref:Polysaccharide biosynthesis protein n=2 Tax=Pararhizobium mangrovi TaxID=2590452 RepID=A0A506U6D1_9HYPH|nr:polysaccharide biosynthesis protein [Pararhizobium mangrovi]
MTIVFVVLCAVLFPLLGLYRINWKYASIPAYVVLISGVVVASLLFAVLIFVDDRLDFVPRSVIVIQVMVLSAMLCGFRLNFRHEELLKGAPYFRKRLIAAGETIPVLLVGAGREADLYLRALNRDPNSNYRPLGILDDRPEEMGRILHGVPVIGATRDFEDRVGELELLGNKPRHIIFSKPLSEIGKCDADLLIQNAERLGLAVSRLAPATLLRQSVTSGDFDLRPIELTDLLERPQASLDVAALERFIRERRVLVTGAGGSIGSELTKQVAALNPTEIVLIDHSEFNLYTVDLDLKEQFPELKRTCYLCDVRDAARLNEIFERHHPELVFHAAALKHVPMVELNPCEGLLTNVCGTMNVAEAARRWNALGMVQVSTDKAVNSRSVMGATKRLAELYCQAMDLDCESGRSRTRFMTVRFGNVLGSSGSLIPLFKRQLAKGGPLTVTHPEMTRYFMTIREAVQLTLQASSYGLEKELGKGQIFVLDMGEPIKIVDIARRMIRLSGVPDRDIAIDIVGCRPGEKLYEELFDADEQRVSPPVPGVLGAVPKAVPLSVIYENFAHLKDLALAGKPSQLVDAMRELVPGFCPEVESAATAHAFATVRRDADDIEAALDPYLIPTPAGPPLPIGPN